MDAITRFEGRAADWLARDYRRRVEQDTLRRAYAAFARCYRRWADSLFDLTFLATVSPEMLEKGNAARLAEAYVAQLSSGKPALSEQSVQMAMPVAAAFLQLLAKERGRHDHPTAWKMRLV